MTDQEIKLMEMRKAFSDWLEEKPHQPSVWEIEDYWMEVIAELV